MPRFSASTTTRHSSRPRACATSARTTGPGSTSRGATTAGSSRARWPRSRTRWRSAARGRPPSDSIAAIVRRRRAARSSRARKATAPRACAFRRRARRTRTIIRRALAPRHIFNASVGTDNLLRTEHARVTLRLSVLNLTNKSALYNFLSTLQRHALRDAAVVPRVDRIRVCAPLLCLKWRGGVIEAFVDDFG